MNRSALPHFVLVLFALMVTPNIVTAQDEGGRMEPSAGGVIEEIVVTALRRSASLQDAPAAVDVFHSELIEQAGISGMRDYVGLSPNITLIETQNSSFAFVNVRGLSQVRNSEPTVAVVIDGVLQTTGLGFSQDLYDIQQVEVLKGPQGAIYGRNASGGAIIINTKQPGNETEGFIRAGYGNGANVSVAGMASGALVEDKLFARAVVGYNDRDGWRDNITLGKEADPYKDFSVRGKLIWTPNEDFSADLRASFSDTRTSQSQFFVNSPNFIVPPPEGGLPGIAHSFDGRVNGTSYRLPGQPASIAHIIGDPNNTSVQVEGNVPGQDDREITTISAKLDWETAIGTVTSVTAYDELDSLAWDQESFPYFPFLQSSADPTAGTRTDAIVLDPGLFAALSAINATIGQNRFHKSFSQELRITSPDDQRVRWILGGYYAATDLDVMIAVNNDLGMESVKQGTQPNIGGTNPTATWDERFIATVAPVLSSFYAAVPGAIPAPCLVPPLDALPNAVCGAILANPNSNAGALSYNFDTNDNTAYALFGQLSIDLTDTVELSLALRYDRDERELTIAADDQYLPVFAFSSGREGDVRNDNFDSVQPNVTIRWQPTDDWTLYGVYAEGFRSGGFNLSGVSAGVTALTAAGVPGMPEGVEDSWKQEDTQAFELGFKANFLDRRVAISGSAFYTQIDNAFTFSFIAPFNAQVIRNIDEADILGFETAISWLATDNLRFDLNFGLLDTEITKSSWLGAGGIDIVGNEMPLNPENTLNLGVTYTRPLFNDWDSFIRVDYKRLGETPFEPENFATRDPVNLVDMRVGLTGSNGWEIVGWVRNLTDEDYTVEFTNPNGISWPSALRHFGIEFTKRF